MNRKTLILSATIAVVISLIFSGVVYAAISNTLTINGTASVKGASWSVKFKNLTSVALTGTAREVTAPTINTNDTKIGNYELSLTTPGDSATYTFDVANEGTFNAKITSISIPTPVCTGTSSTATTDASNVCENLSYTLTYSNGTPVALNDTLPAGQTKTMKLKLSYSNAVTAQQLPKNDVAISGLTISLIYSQS